MTIVTRRECLAAIPAAGALSFLAHGGAPARAAAPAAQPYDSFPSQDAELVREMVGVCHGNLERVTQLLKDAPRLANAAVDWGFGDWETALGAAAHTGRVAIARLLLEHGARADIFAMAMLGRLEAVKAMIADEPGIQRVRGPHGFTLLHHARAGGDAAKPVYDYLSTLPDADVKTPTEALIAPNEAYTGVYRYGPDGSSLLEVVVMERQAQLAIQRLGGTPRPLAHLGGHAFHPMGAPEVRVAFTMEGERATGLAITSPAPVLTATRE